VTTGQVFQEEVVKNYPHKHFCYHCKRTFDCYRCSTPTRLGDCVHCRGEYSEAVERLDAWIASLGQQPKE